MIIGFILFLVIFITVIVLWTRYNNKQEPNRLKKEEEESKKLLSMYDPFPLQGLGYDYRGIKLPKVPASQNWGYVTPPHLRASKYPPYFSNKILVTEDHIKNNGHHLNNHPSTSNDGYSHSTNSNIHYDPTIGLLSSDDDYISNIYTK